MSWRFNSTGGLAVAPGVRLGRLVIVKRRARRSSRQDGVLLLRCDCGTELEVAAERLQAFQLASCGRCDRAREQRLFDAAQRLQIAPGVVTRYLVNPTLVPKPIQAVFEPVERDSSAVTGRRLERVLVAIRNALVHESAEGLVHLTAGKSEAAEDSEIAREFPHLFEPLPDELGRGSSEDLQDVLDDDGDLPQTAAGAEGWRLPRCSELVVSSLRDSGMNAIISLRVFDDIERAIDPTRVDSMETAALLGGTIGKGGIEIREAVRPRQQRHRYSVKLDGDDVQRIVDSWRERDVELVGVLHSQPTRWLSPSLTLTWRVGCAAHSVSPASWRSSAA